MAEHEHRVIYLEPRCASESGEDRHWCQDDAWGTCDECGTPSVKYIIASEHEAMVKALQDIAAIENQEFGPDWEEIDQARKIANDALTAIDVGGVAK